jgi:hypothetical protein
LCIVISSVISCLNPPFLGDFAALREIFVLRWGGSKSWLLGRRRCDYQVVETRIVKGAPNDS